MALTVHHCNAVETQCCRVFAEEERAGGRAVGRKTVEPLSVFVLSVVCLSPECTRIEAEVQPSSRLCVKLLGLGFASVLRKEKKNSEIRSRWPHLQRPQCCWIWSLASPFLISFVVPSVLLPVPLGFFHSRRCRARRGWGHGWISERSCFQHAGCLSSRLAFSFFGVCWCPGQRKGAGNGSSSSGSKT